MNLPRKLHLRCKTIEFLSLASGSMYIEKIFFYI